MRHLVGTMMIGVCGLLSFQALAQQKTPDAVVIVPATEATPPTKPPSPPKYDEACVRANAEKASAICARKIESQAIDDYEWITRPFTGIFQQADPSKGEEPVATYRGDSIRFMSPQKEWIRVSYECAFDVEKQVVTGLRVRPGRIDKPVALQAPKGAAQPNNGGGQEQASQPVASAPLAAAILQAAKQGSAAHKDPAHSPPQIKIGEPSAIDILQVSPRRGTY